jgi:hypothetical protein
MAVGLVVTKEVLDAAAGRIAKTLNETLGEAAALKAYLDAKTVPDLEALGYSAAEAAVLKSGAGDMDSLRRVYEGAAATGQYDFRVFVRQLWGLCF